MKFIIILATVFTVFCLAPHGQGAVSDIGSVVVSDIGIVESAAVSVPKNANIDHIWRKIICPRYCNYVSGVGYTPKCSLTKCM